MQRTPAQSAEGRDPSAEQQGPSDEQRSQSEERRQQLIDIEWQADLDRLIHTTYARDIGQCGPPYERWMLTEFDTFARARDSTYRNLIHLRSQTKALREAVARAKENSIKRQVKFLNSAFKEYQDACERVLEEKRSISEHRNDNTPQNRTGRTGQAVQDR
jgi:hypothetical protein